MKHFEIYTDGACSGNPGKGGCAFIIIKDGKKLHHGSFGYRHTTNNRMEILAVVRAIQCIWFRELENTSRDTDIKVTVYFDSQLVVNTMNLGWAKKTNADLWEELDDSLGVITGNVTIEFVKVKGHAGNHWNEEVDHLAVAAYGEKDLEHDKAYEKISAPKSEPTLFAGYEEPTVEDIVLKGQSTPDNRHIEVNLSNGTVVKISPCYEGFEQYNCSKREALVTVDIALRFNGWLHGKKL